MSQRTCLSVILAAGEGTRMKSALPKVLHQIAETHNPVPASTSTASSTATAAADSIRKSAATRKPSVWAMTKHLWATSGPRALLDGLGLRCARKAASSAIGWSIFEGGRSWYTEREQRRAGAQNLTPPTRVLDHKQV